MRIRKFIGGFIFAVCLASLAQADTLKVPKSEWADFNGGKLHYYDIGKRSNKNALVFIHGWTGSADLWRGSYGAFPNYRVIALDLVGHGNSHKPRTDYTMEFFARSVAAVLDDAGVRKAVFVGHSMGMPVARQFYRLYPARTLGIVNVDGSIRSFPDKKQYEGFLAQFRADYNKTREMFIGSMIQSIKDEKVKQAIQSSNNATPDYVGISAMSQFGNEELWKTDPINVPVLAIIAQSPWWPADTESFHRSFTSNLDFQTWTGVSHFLFMERPGEFNELIRKFIAKNKLL